jgi:hypothetical protein
VDQQGANAVAGKEELVDIDVRGFSRLRRLVGFSSHLY